MGIETFFPSVFHLTLGTLGIAGILYFFVSILRTDTQEETEI